MPAGNYIPVLGSKEQDAGFSLSQKRPFLIPFIKIFSEYFTIKSHMIKKELARKGSRLLHMASV